MMTKFTSCEDGARAGARGGGGVPVSVVNECEVDGRGVVLLDPVQEDSGC